MSEEEPANTPVPKLNGMKKSTKELKDSFSRELKEGKETKEGKINETPGKIQPQ
jgi:hypothetical protein